jgi:arylformamidase
MASVAVARPSPEWLDQQYDNRARVPEHERIFARWREASALVRERSARRLDLAYGQGPNETLDLFVAPGDRAPILFFIHGGYWRSLDKADQSFIAPAFVQQGAMVVVPNYALCPAVTIEAIALQLVKAMVWTVRHATLYGGDARRIVVAGHSAGAHLAAMLLSCDWRSLGMPARTVRAALGLSGLYDLAPIEKTPFLQADLRLTPEAVRKLSPAGFPPPQGRLFALVGEQESDEFKRQTRLIHERWGEQTVPVYEQVAGADHFTILHELADPEARTHRLALQLLAE